MEVPGVPKKTQISVNGVDLAVWEWAGQDPPVLFCHATGFHARCWDQIIADLPGQHCLALDFRGHGQSSKPPAPYSWRTFGEDLAALADRLALPGLMGIGHSMGAHALALAAAMRPGVFSSLLLVDPVIQVKSRYTGPNHYADFVARRRNQWESPGEMFERFKDRPPFADWNIDVLRDYCDYGLLPAPSGQGFELACPPDIEASIYSNSSAKEADIYAEIATVEIPVRVVRADGDFGKGDFSGSPTAPDLASRFRHGEDIHLAGRSHFIPMETPDLVARLVSDAYLPK